MGGYTTPSGKTQVGCYADKVCGSEGRIPSDVLLSTTDRTHLTAELLVPTHNKFAHTLFRKSSCLLVGAEVSLQGYVS